MAIQAPTVLAQLLEPHGVLAWLATYLVHSTLLLGGTWLASRWLRGRSLSVEEGLWKAALVGGLLTATVQTGLAALPEAPEPAAPQAAERIVAAPSLPASWSVAAPESSGVTEPVTPHPSLDGLAAALPGWQRLALAGWLGGCLLLLGRLAVGWLRLRHRLRGREDVADGPVGRLLDRLLARTAIRRPVRLTGTTALRVPVALGVGEREICLPDRALRELDDRRQAGLLAHELAHLERRDPAWLLTALTLQGVFFFQPLNRLARRRLEEISELRCDEWAVRATGDRVGLARCLTEVASWLAADRRSALPVPGMARSGGHLGTRVRRILDTGADEPRPRRWMAVGAAVTLVAGVLLVPGLAPATFADPDAAVQDDRAAARPATPPAESSRAGNASPGDEGAGEAPGRDPDLDTAGIPDTEEISRLVAEALAAARAAVPGPAELAEIQEEVRAAATEAMEARREALQELERALDLELDGLAEGRELTAAEKARLREEIEREVATAHRELERALAAARPELEELGRMNLYLGKDMAEELARARRELERVNRELKVDLARELGGAREQMERAERQMRVEREELRRHLDEELREARRQLEIERRELEETRRQLELERRELEELRERHEEREEEAPPPAS